ncbi:MAG: LysM peptidoglycan-binding domain-containing protein [Desulfobacteraceae bacterium]|nr:LysM peptidoglycan-binding domain-containing protein [Desulfobacteraceae bacterium]
MRRYRLLCLLPLLVLVFAGCVSDHTEKKDSVALTPPRIEPPAFILHRVMPGETMATIARWYSGKDSQWRELAEHNPDLSPWNLKKGEIVKVPTYMATVHSEQPNFSTAPKKTKKKAASKAEEELPPGPDEVFGPK